MCRIVGKSIGAATCEPKAAVLRISLRQQPNETQANWCEFVFLLMRRIEAGMSCKMTADRSPITVWVLTDWSGHINTVGLQTGHNRSDHSSPKKLIARPHSLHGVNMADGHGRGL